MLPYAEDNEEGVWGHCLFIRITSGGLERAEPKACDATNISNSRAIALSVF
jgi:hypothetical protein